MKNQKLRWLNDQAKADVCLVLRLSLYTKH